MFSKGCLSIFQGLKVALVSGCLLVVSGAANAESVPDLSEGMMMAQANSSDIVWQRLNQQETQNTINSILDSPMGVAALNQLAIEGFIAFNCRKSYYQDVNGFRWLLQVNCPTPRGVSTAVAYDEMRVVFNTFEGSIESFTTERHGVDLEITPLRLD